MPDTGIFCNQAEMLRKAGTNVSSLLTASVDTTFTYSNDYITQAESYINVASNFNFSDVYASLNADVKAILKDCASSLSAIYCINFDMSGYTSRAEAQTMLNVLWERVNNCINLLRDMNNRKFISGA